MRNIPRSLLEKAMRPKQNPVKCTMRNIPRSLLEKAMHDPCFNPDNHLRHHFLPTTIILGSP